MKNARCKVCERTDAESLAGGLGGLAYGLTASHGRYGSLCVSHIVEAPHTVGGRVPVWATPDTAPVLSVEVSGLRPFSGDYGKAYHEAAGLALDGWAVSADLSRASRSYLSMQGVDKALTALRGSHTVAYSVSIDGRTVSTVAGKNNRRTYSRAVLAWVKALRACKCPALYAWSEDAAEAMVEEAARTGRNLGVAEVMAARDE